MQEGQGTRFCGRQVGKGVCCQFGLSSNTVSFRGCNNYNNVGLRTQYLPCVVV